MEYMESKRQDQCDAADNAFNDLEEWYCQLMAAADAHGEEFLYRNMFAWATYKYKGWSFEDTYIDHCFGFTGRYWRTDGHEPGE